MYSDTNYYMLVASLPHMPRTFELDQVPISRIRLQQRLAMLGEHDRNVVEQVQGFLLWDRQHPERTDEEVQREYDRLMKSIANKLVRDIVGHRMDVRTITSALRRRTRTSPAAGAAISRAGADRSKGSRPVVMPARPLSRRVRSRPNRGPAFGRSPSPTRAPRS